MRKSVMLMIVLGSMACGDGLTSNENRLPPPSLEFRATSRQILNADNTVDLEVSAAVWNPTSVHIQVAAGAQCPLGVRLFPDSTGIVMGHLSASMACPAGRPNVDLAPSDTITLTHVVRADSLVLLSSGTYGVNVIITSSNAIMGGWAGAVHLPLGRP